MRVYPIGHGNHNNVYCAAKKFGYKFKLVLFFGTERAYVISHRRTNSNIQVDRRTLYNALKSGVESMDFELVTSKKKFLNKLGESDLQKIKRENE